MATSNHLSLAAIAHKSVEPSGVFSESGAWVGSVPGGPTAYGETRHYAFTTSPDPRNTTINDMTGGVGGVKPGGETARELGYRKAYATSEDGRDMISPRPGLVTKDAHGNPLPEHLQMRALVAEPRTSGRGLAGRRLAKAALRDARLSLAMGYTTTRDPYNLRYTNSGLGNFDHDLPLVLLPANHEANPGLFHVERLQDLNQEIDQHIVAESYALNRTLSAEEKEIIRNELIDKYVEKGKNPDYPNTKALQEMVSVTAQDQRVRDLDRQKALDMQTTREKMRSEADEAARLQGEANRTIIAEAAKADERHTKIKDLLKKIETAAQASARHAEIIALLEQIKTASDTSALQAQLDTIVTAMQTAERTTTAEGLARGATDGEILDLLTRIADSLHGSGEPAAPPETPAETEDQA